MGATSKRARKIREAAEFDTARGAPIPPRPGRIISWTWDTIASARDAQQRGQFALPSQLAASMRTDDAIFTAYETRLAPQRCIRVLIKQAAGARGASIAKEAEALYGVDGVGATAATMSDLHGDLVDHGVAIGVIDKVPREDGSRVDFFLRHWPMWPVYWDDLKRCFMTRLEDGSLEEIHHGDGRWVVFAKHDFEPWRKEACLLPAAMVWAVHAFGLKDWAKGSRGQGNAKVVGALAPGQPLQDSESEALTPQARAFLEMLKGLYEGDNPVGIKPDGATLEWLGSNSNNWQIFDRLILSREKAAARIYLGTDGTLGAAGGAPGVDIEALFDVAATRVEGDLGCLALCFLTGVIEPWCAVNFGDSSLAPKRVYDLPDRDADAACEAEDKRRTAFFAAVDRARSTGFQVTPEWVTALGKSYAITPPELVQAASAAPQIQLAPTDIARVVSVNEARASAGLGPLMLPDGSGEDPAGRLTIEQYAARVAAPPAVAPPAPVAPAAATSLSLVRNEPPKISAREIATHEARMMSALLADVRERRELGIETTQRDVDEIARRYGVPAPLLKAL